MKHASDRELLDMLAANRHAPEELARHLDQCAECRRRLEAYAGTWDLLGRVGRDDIPAELAEGIMRAAERQGRPAGRSGVAARLWASVGPIGRAAAVIVAASTAGFAVGRFTAPAGPRHTPAGRSVTSDEVAQAVFLDELATAPLGISEALSMATEPQGEEQER